MSTYGEASTYDQSDEYAEEGEGKAAREKFAEELYNLRQDGFDVL